MSCTASDATSTRSFPTSTRPLAAAKCKGVQPQAGHAAGQCLKYIEIQEIHCRFELDWPKSTSPRFLTSSSKEVWTLNFRQYGEMEMAQPGRISDVEKVRREKIRDGESQKREDASARKGKEVARNTVFFRCFVAPEGRKVGSLKRRVRRHRGR